LTTLDELYKKDLQKKASDKSEIIPKASAFSLKQLYCPEAKKDNRELEQKPKETWLKCGFTNALCNKEECSLWIVTYQRCCFVSIAKALDIISSILDDRLGEEQKLAT